MKRLDRTRRLLALGLVITVALIGFQMTNTAAAHAAPVPAAGTQPAASAAVNPIKGNAASYHPTPTQRAYAADKSLLAEEYAHQVLTGRESLAVYESHYRAFMIKWHLGNVANLSAALTRGTALVLSNAPNLRPNCPSVAGGLNLNCPVYAAQFPEENWNWCGPATLSTTLIEDSFNWPGTNQYGGETLTRNGSYITQPYHPAYDDELWLAQNGVISGNIWQNGTSPNQMTTVVDNFVNGKGGWYAQEWLSGSLSSQIADYQPKVTEDVGTGWTVPDGIDIGAGNFWSMPGYPYSHNAISHWLPVTDISSDGNTVYYADPIYAAPAYSYPGSPWTPPPPFESTNISNIVLWTTLILW